MLLNYELTTNLKIETLMDLNKIKQFEESSNLKVNRSQLAREMNVDRRTISKYIQGYKKKTNRTRESQFDSFYTTINELLDHPDKVFAYKRVLWQYLCDNYGVIVLNQASEGIYLQNLNLISISRESEI